jgi:FAD:protein FMN transferase
MGARVYIAAYTGPTTRKAAANAAVDAALAEMGRLERLLSEWLNDSDIGRINSRAGDWVEVAPETLDVVERDIWAGELSEGAFDITFQVMRGLWNFGSDSDTSPRVPSAADVAPRRALIDYRSVRI